MSKTITLDQKLKRLKVNPFEVDNEIVFNFFNNLPDKDRDNALLKALYIGVLAMMEDRLSAFLAKTQNELGTELESLKMLFEMKKEIFFKSSVKGLVAEGDIANFLTEYLKDKNINDKIILTGGQAGNLSKNKTGDIVCLLDGRDDKKIVIEVKFDKTIRLGDLADRDIFTKKQDTAWSQIIEAKANRDSKVGMIVFDISLVDSSILKYTDSVGYINGIGFIAIVDSQKGKYDNLIIAYNLARDIAINSKELDFDGKLLTMILGRLIKDIDTYLSIKTLVESNIETNKEILKRLRKSLLLMEFSKKYLDKFLKDGKLNNQDILDFYRGDEVKAEYQVIEKEIENLIK